MGRRSIPPPGIDVSSLEKAMYLIEVTMSFAIGLLAGPIAIGFTYFFINIVVTCVYSYVMGWCLVTKIVASCAGMMGWILSRWLYYGYTGLEIVSGSLSLCNRGDKKT